MGGTSIKYLHFLKFIFFCIFLTILNTLEGQSIDEKKDSSQINSARLQAAIIVNGTAIVGSAYYLYQSWHSTVPFQKFHFINDNHHWNQMDKFGHAFSSYYMTNIFRSELEWAGVGRKKASIYASLTAWVSITTIDVMDGFSSRWGIFSR